MRLIAQADTAILQAVNGLAGQSPFADAFVLMISGNDIVKGVVPVLFMWAIWFGRSPRQVENRRLVLSAVVIACVAIVVGRGLALTLPFRTRPLHANLDFLHLPLGMGETTLDGWSSLPSDHAVLYFSLAAVLFLYSRRIGILLFAHAILFISLPRIYLGLHYPSDIAAGALVGTGLGLALAWPVAHHLIPRLGFLGWEARQPQTFYPFAFFVMFQVATMFNTLRALAGALH